MCDFNGKLVNGAPLVRGDRVQLEQAVINLLINGYEAMHEAPQDQREMLIRSEIIGGLVLLSFRDSGCGISPQVIDRIFDAFYSTKSSGMGMGLSLCKSITEAHGGEISARSNEGDGTTFFLSLPISKNPIRESKS